MAKVGDHMVSNGHWDQLIQSKMVRCSYKGRRVFTYTAAAANLYVDLAQSEGRYGDKVAIVADDGKTYTYSAFRALVDNLAQHFKQKYNVGKGDKIALLLYNTVEFCTAVYAISKLGAVVVPMNSKCKPGEWAQMLSQIPVRLLLLDTRLIQHKGALEKQFGEMAILLVEDSMWSHLPKADQLIEPDSCWEDEFIYMFTSGTTATSKCVVLSNFNVSNAISTYEAVLPIGSEDRTVISTPIYHITGLVALLGLFVHCGGTIYLHLKYDPVRVLQCVETNKITLIHASPTVFTMLWENMKPEQDLSSLTQFACGSANMPPEMIIRLKDRLPQMSFRTIYGLTENSSPASIFPGDAARSSKIGSSGLPIPGMQMKVVDDEGKPVPVGETGELMMYGMVILDRYYNLETDALSADGWLKTGDIARLDQEGYIYIVDRKKDMINRGGEKIWSNEVENVIHKMGGVAEVVIIGIPDEKYGEVVMAVIRRQESPAGESLTESSVQQWTAQKIAKFKVPALVVFVDEIPKTHNGKVSKKTLREQFQAFHT